MISNNSFGKSLPTIDVQAKKCKALQMIDISQVMQCFFCMILTTSKVLFSNRIIQKGTLDHFMS